MTISLNKMKSKHWYGAKRKSAIETLKNNKDLNNILDGIDNLAKGKGVPLLDRNALVFVKLKPKNNTDDFNIDYSLIALMASLLYSFNVKAVSSHVLLFTSYHHSWSIPFILGSLRVSKIKWWSYLLLNAKTICIQIL